MCQCWCRLCEAVGSRCCVVAAVLPTCFHFPLLHRHMCTVMQSMPAVTSAWLKWVWGLGDNADCLLYNAAKYTALMSTMSAAVLTMLSALTGWPADLLVGCPALLGAPASRGCCAGAADFLSPAGASMALSSGLLSGFAAGFTAADLEASGAGVSVVVPLTALATCCTTALVGVSLLASAALLSCIKKK